MPEYRLQQLGSPHRSRRCCILNYAQRARAVLRRSAIHIAAGGLLGVGCWPAPASAQVTTPNIVLILADDLGWGDIQSNNPDSAMTTTRIDSIAGAGIRFSDAHSPSGSCTPTRYGLLTGRYAWRSWLQAGVANEWDRPLIGPGRPTLGTLLQAHGYRTATVGKWHLGMDFGRLSDIAEVTKDNRGVDFDAEILDGPLDHGFDEFFGTSGNVEYSFPHGYIRNKRFAANPDNDGPNHAGIYGDSYAEILARTTEEAVSFIERAGRTADPFFLYFPLTAPHLPLAPNEQFAGQTGLGPYGDVVAQLDWTVGQVLDALDGVGARDNTLVIFTSDNGSYMDIVSDSAARDHTDSAEIRAYRRSTHKSNGDWRGRKAGIHEGGHRVPLLMRWPERIAAGSTTPTTVSLTDLYKTLADIVGQGPVPGVAPDSVSLLPLLRGDALARGISVVHHSADGTFGLRDGRWKLVSGSRPQLFDLERDPRELRNFASSNPEVVTRLEAALASIRAAEAGSLSADATLRKLRLAGVDIGTFAGDVRSYTATVGPEVERVEVTAIPTETDARVVIASPDGRYGYGKRRRGRVELELATSPTTTITAHVTSPDKSATATYTVTVTRGPGVVPLKAIFSEMPETHDGETSFTLALQFSEEVDLSYSAFTEGLVAVSGGTVGQASRLEPPSNIGWRFPVTPDGDGDVVITLPANRPCDVQPTVCTYDGRRLSASASITVVGPATVLRPEIVGASSFTVAEGTTAVATLTATDADTQTADLSWSIPSDAAGGADRDHFTLSSIGVLAFAATKDFEVPDDADQDGIYQVTVQVSDGERTDTADLTVTLTNVNEAPTANAGADQEDIAEGATVTLGGSGADPDADDELTYAWTQTGGPQVALSDVAATAPTLTAPTGLAADATLTFSLQVTDRAGLSHEDAVSVTVKARPQPVATIAAGTSPVTEGADVTFTVSLDAPAATALAVPVSVSETGAALSGSSPATVDFAAGESSKTLSLATADDLVVEADSAVTATVTAGTGYSVGTASSATVTVEDDDAATFTVSADAEAISEGESATLTVAISNGVSFAEAQTISLTTSGTASAADYTGVPETLGLAAGQASVTATLAAASDQEEEEAETVTVTASHGGSAIGSATVTINSVSHDATLGTLSLSGIDIGTFSGAVTSYEVSVANLVTAATVTATATHSAAAVAIEPGPEVSLAVGANRIVIAVRAEDGTTTKTYTVTVTRAGLPEASIAAASSPVTEGTAASFTVTLDQAAPEALTVAVSVTESGSALSGTPPASVAFAKGETRATLSVPTATDSVVEADSTVTATVTSGTGYAVGTGAAASVTVEDDDTATFTVSADAEAISEGESATLTVAISNGVTFAEAQTLSLATSGTAGGSDYTVVPPTLTLAAGTDSVTATLAAAVDQEEEQAETVTVTASRGGSAIGSATVTINSISHDATLGSLSLAGIDIGTFSDAVTSYQASVDNSVETTTVTVTASHSGATLSIEPGSEVNLAVGANEIRITVRAEDGKTTKTYTVTVTRSALPVVSIVAVEERVSEAELARFTVTRTGPTADPLDVQVLFTSTTSERVRTLTVRLPPGQSSVTKRVQAGDNTRVQDDVTVTWTLGAGEGYTVAAENASAAVVLEENDVPAFAVSVEPAEIAEGESATVTVAITNGVTFQQPETITLAVSGTASASDYSGVPETLTLNAYTTRPRFSATATLRAAPDQEEEAAETVTITASHGGAPIGSATVTINSISHDATLGSLSLAGIDIGTFSGALTSYQASVGNSVETTTVTATATHSAAEVSVEPGSEVSLAVGANEIAVSVTAEDGTTTKTYTVTVTRAALPVVSIAAVEERVSEAEMARFTVSRTGPAADPLDVQVLFASTTSERVQTLTVGLSPGQSSVTKRVQGGDNTIVEDDVTVTWTLGAGEGYTVAAENASAAVVLEENDVPAFAVSVEPAEIAEGESATVTVAITNGVTFRQPETIDLAVSGTASAADYSGVPETLRLYAFSTRPRFSATATLRAAPDQEEEAAETVTITASHGGVPIGSATVTINSASRDATPEFALSVDPAEVLEGGSATIRVSITNGATFAEDQSIALDFAGSTATEGSDFTVSAGSLRLRARANSATTTVRAVDDGTAEEAETVAITASHGSSEIGSATVTISDGEQPALTAQFVGMPATHDGEAAFKFELRFSEEIEISYVTLRDTAFQITGGAVRGARRLARSSNARWEITVQPASEADVELTLPVTTNCAAAGAICTAGGAGLSQEVNATVGGPGSEDRDEGFPLAPQNSSPSGIWSDGETAWVADLDDARLYAYRRSDGERQPGKDIATDPAPMGLWSDGEALWVAGLGGGLRAHRLADGSRLAARDLALEANTAPAGVWADGETAWVADWLGDTVHAYRLSDGRREAGRDVKLAGGNLMPVGLWADGETLWVADWRERVYAYRLSDGSRDPARDIEAGETDTDPTGLWSGGGTLLATGWASGEVRAYRLPEVVADKPGKQPGAGLTARAVSLPAIADPALQAAIGAALGKAPGEAVSPQELAGLEALTARSAGIRDLSGLEQAVRLKDLDLGFNPLADLRPLAGLPALESLSLDGAAANLQALAPLARLQRLSLRHNGLDDLGPLAGLTSLVELDLGDNRIADLRPLAGLANLAVLRADRNQIADLWPLASLAGLEALELGANRVRDLHPLAGLARLQSLRLGGNGLAELHPLAGLEGLRDLVLAGNAVADLRALSHLDGLRRLDLRGNPVGDLRPLRALKSLAWVHVGGSRIEDLGPLNGLPGLTMAGRDDRQPPSVQGGQNGRASQQ